MKKYLSNSSEGSGGGATAVLLSAGLLSLLFFTPKIIGFQMPAGGPPAIPDLPSVRGTVQSIHGNDAVIQTQSGKTYTIHASDNTRMYKDRQPIQMTVVHIGDMLIGAGDLDEKTNLLRAIFVADVDAATVAKMRADLGKTWIAGKVLKIDETKITVERIDRKIQTIEADETTSFRKDGQDVTLLDVHVGDPIRGKGSIKNGLFVPTELTVLGAAARRRMGEAIDHQ
jgi:hypothetical protein